MFKKIPALMLLCAIPWIIGMTKPVRAEYIGINELQTEANIEWKKEYVDRYGRTVSVDVTPIIPQVDKVPIQIMENQILPVENVLNIYPQSMVQEEKREEIRKQREESPKEDVISDREIVKTRSSNFSFPMDMDDDPIPRTFVNTTSSNYNTAYNNNKNVLDKEKKVSELYAKKEEPKPKKFKPTPVISPVYGVLDKNYTKDEVKVQDEDSYEIKRPSRKVDFETVRNKAFGSLTDDIRNNLCENCELYKEVKITKNANKKLLSDDDNLLSEMTKDDVKDVTLEEAEDNYFDFGVDYEIPKKEEKPSVVINAKEVEVNDSDVKIVNHNGTESTAEKIEVKEEPPKRTTRVTVKKELEDTKEFEKVSPEEKTIDEALNGGKDISADEDNDIFNLIDSMYEGDE